MLIRPKSGYMAPNPSLCNEIPFICRRTRQLETDVTSGMLTTTPKVTWRILRMRPTHRSKGKEIMGGGGFRKEGHPEAT